MRSSPDPTVFSPNYLRHLGERDIQGVTAAEAEYSGPWQVVERDDRFAVVLATAAGDSPPEASFKWREVATLMAAVLPFHGRPRHYALGDERTEHGFEVRIVGEDADLHPIGHLRYHQPELLQLLLIAEWFLRSPDALARLLTAASHQVVVRAGRLVAEHIAKEAKA